MKDTEHLDFRGKGPDVIVVQHIDIDPVGLLAKAIRYPEFHHLSRTGFRLRCTIATELVVSAKGAGLQFDPEGVVETGEIDGLVLSLQDIIAAQFIGCNLPARLVHRAVRDRLDVTPANILGRLRMESLDIIVMR